MSKTVIEVNNLGKQYRLGAIGRSSMSDDLKRFLYRVRGKEDPFLKIGEDNDRSKKGDSEYVWALRDINFKVGQGEVLGIIGKNGAGKSTLLKILSRTTLPTLGEYKVRGRIASLLEVGTGFHPDLTGRENIFLNGAILGMTKTEIRRKFDEIVDFSGVERYIDTPVKRYSSGMYVRLAFAVAAHLDPEILIIDEVLAVGDAEFQKKCLGKMKDVSGQGRTVLFVSHNMLAVQSLCNKGMVIANGRMLHYGKINEAVEAYFQASFQNQKKLVWDEGYFQNEFVDLNSVRIDSDSSGLYNTDVPLNVRINTTIKKSNLNIMAEIHLFNQEGIMVFDVVTQPDYYESGNYEFNCIIPKHFLNSGNYSIDVILVQNHNSLLFHKKEVINFEILEGEKQIEYFDVWPGIVRPRLNWEIHKL